MSRSWVRAETEQNTATEGSPVAVFYLNSVYSVDRLLPRFEDFLRLFLRRSWRIRDPSGQRRDALRVRFCLPLTPFYLITRQRTCHKPFNPL